MCPRLVGCTHVPGTRAVRGDRERRGAGYVPGRVAGGVEGLSRVGPGIPGHHGRGRWADHDVVDAGGVVFVRASVVIGSNPDTGVRGNGIVDARCAVHVHARCAGDARVGRVDCRRSGGQVEVSAGNVRPPRVGLDRVGFLPRRGSEGRERGVAHRVPDQKRVRGCQVDQVVVKGGARGRAGLDPDVAVRTRALDAVVGRDVLVHGVRNDRLTGRLVVVDAVVAVVVDDVVKGQVAIRVRVELDPGVL